MREDEAAEAIRRRSLYFAIASEVATRMGSCTRRNVGAVLVCNGRVREVGWNGMEREGHFPCNGGFCPRGALSAEQQPHGVGYSNCVYIHAEFNVLELFRHSQRLSSREGWAGDLGVVVYISGVSPDGFGVSPCEDCARYAAWAGAGLVWDTREL